MADTPDLIDFNVIESHKENIQALPSGRSAKALAQLYSPPLLAAQASPGLLSEAQLKTRADFEKELATIDEADDPLDIYDRYVKWTLDAFPSAQATPQSQLLPLLERATKAFQSDKHYKNDPRYLKIWLHYIRLFSDAPREAFVFLARHAIGESLALYYEEFAAWLENQGRWNQAEEIYRLGMEKEATPAARLTRKFNEFEQRLAARPQNAAEPSSPALPSVRPALAAKLDPFASASPAQSQQGSGSKKSKSSKMQIFADGDEASRPGSGSSGTGWDNFGSLHTRKKENTAERKPMAGQTLKVGKTNGGMEKLEVFKSSETEIPKHLFNGSSTSTHEQQFVFNESTGRLECVFVNLEAVYPEPGNLAVEYCFEELRARHRGWLSKNWKKDKQSRPKKQSRSDTFDVHIDTGLAEQRPAEDSTPQQYMKKTKKKGFEIFEDVPETEAKHSSLNPRDGVLVENVKTLALNDENDENTPPSKQDMEAAKKARREERANRTRKIKVPEVKYIKNETQTIKLNMDSPQKPKTKRKKSIGPAEPTMTINTKEAMEEIYGIFSAPLPSHEEQQDDEDESESGSEAETDYTTGDESTATGKMSAPASEYGDETRNELMKSTRTDDDDRTDVSAWSDFTSSKHVPQADGTESQQPTEHDLQVEEHHHEDLSTPVDDENPRTQYIPVPDEDYDPPANHYQMLPNHRLPFMTPIAEQTESSLGAATGRTTKDYFGGAKTPSRQTGMPEDIEDEEEEEEPPSSPFQDVIADMAEDKRRVLQPIRTKSTKGAITLGQGTAKSQTEKKHGPAAFDLVQTGSIIKDLQCNPMDPAIRETILSQMRPSLSSFEGYYEDLSVSTGQSQDIKKYIKTLSKASRNSMNPDKTAQTLSVPPTVDLPGAQGSYIIKRELGAGTFAPVYLVENSAAAALEEHEDDDDENMPPVRLGKQTHRKPLEAIKMEEPNSTWEFYMIRTTHHQLGISRATESIVRAHEMHLFRDECFLVEEFRDQGTLLDLVNIARLESTGSGSSTGMDEMLAMFFTIELLRTVEALHSKALIHGDLKGDNILVRFDDNSIETDWSSTYFPSGAHGWSSKGVCLIDFGRGIDMKQFEDGVGFIADWKTSENDCAEMRELRPWTYQIDYHGLAGIIHSMLFGKYMETVADKTPHDLSQGSQTRTYRIRESFKRYWQVDIWSEVFALLLNPMAHIGVERDGKMPVLQGMRGCRERMEGWLEENCERGIGLKGLILRMEAAVKERRKRRGV